MLLCWSLLWFWRFTGVGLWIAFIPWELAWPLHILGELVFWLPGQIFKRFLKFMYIPVHACYAYIGAYINQKKAATSWAGVTCLCEPFHMGTGNWTLGSLVEQQELVLSEPSLQPSSYASLVGCLSTNGPTFLQSLMMWAAALSESTPSVCTWWLLWRFRYRPPPFVQCSIL